MRTPGESWRAAYHRMFVRFRDQLREEVRQGRRPFLTDDAIDRRAWREAARAVERAINMQADHGEARAKARRGEAA